MTLFYLSRIKYGKLFAPIGSDTLFSNLLRGGGWGDHGDDIAVPSTDAASRDPRDDAPGIASARQYGVFRHPGSGSCGADSLACAVTAVWLIELVAFSERLLRRGPNDRGVFSERRRSGGSDGGKERASGATEKERERERGREGKRVHEQCTQTRRYASPRIGTVAVATGHAAPTIAGIRDVAPLLPPPPACSSLLTPQESVEKYTLSSSLFLSRVLSQHPGHIDASSRYVDGHSRNNAHGSWPPRRVHLVVVVVVVVVVLIVIIVNVAASHKKCLPSTPIVRPCEPPDRRGGSVYVSPAPTAIATDTHLCLILPGRLEN